MKSKWIFPSSSSSSSSSSWWWVPGEDTFSSGVSYWLTGTSCSRWGSISTTWFAWQAQQQENVESFRKKKKCGNGSRRLPVSPPPPSPLLLMLIGYFPHVGSLVCVCVYSKDGWLLCCMISSAHTQIGGLPGALFVSPFSLLGVSSSSPFFFFSMKDKTLRPWNFLLAERPTLVREDGHFGRWIWSRSHHQIQFLTSLKEWGGGSTFNFLAD